MEDNSNIKQPKKPTDETKKFKDKLDRLKGIEFENLEEFIKVLDSMN